MELCSHKTHLILFSFTVQLIRDGSYIKNTLFLQLIHKPFKLKMRRRKKQQILCLLPKITYCQLALQMRACIFDEEDSTKIKITKISSYT